MVARPGERDGPNGPRTGVLQRAGTLDRGGTSGDHIVDEGDREPVEPFAAVLERPGNVRAPFAEALPNLLNPFWMLPLMGILSVRTRDLAGFSILQLLVHAPIIFLLTWALSYTLVYVPPLFP